MTEELGDTGSRGEEVDPERKEQIFSFPLLWRVQQGSRDTSLSSKGIVECYIGLVRRVGRSWYDDGRKKGESFRREFVVL